MLAILRRLSSFLIVRMFFLVILLFFFFVCLSSFGVVSRFCMSRRGDSSWSLLVIVSAGYGIFAFVIEALCCCEVGRRVGVGRVEGLLLV